MPLGFAGDVRPLFRDKDVRAMRSAGGFNLSKYEDVAARADSILTRLTDGSMPCDAAWPSERIALFRRWIEEGKHP
jgi:hypothetical protein